jgi:SAM-dependent methyltransferase
MRPVAPSARYDPFAAWYDKHLAGFAARATPLLGAWLGPGPGHCLELGCGGGIQLATIAALGWSAVGLDLSLAQLRLARRRRRAGALVRADAAAAPFPDAAFDAVVGAFIHTDVDDWQAVVAEAARLVRPGGSFVYVGTHPCFVGPFARYRGTAPPRLYPGYRRTGLSFVGPASGPGLRRRVGARHVPLARLVQALLDAGFQLRAVAEPGPEDYPRVLAILSVRP